MVFCCVFCFLLTMQRYGEKINWQTKINKKLQKDRKMS